MKNREEIYNLIEKSLKICRNNFIDHVAGYEDSYFENLTSFLPLYCSMIQIRDNAFQNKILQRFLSIQNDCYNRDFFIIHFIEGYPFEICLAAEFIGDLDLSSVLTITHFERMILYKNRRGPSKKWSDKEVNSIIKSIRKDIGFEYKIKKIIYENGDALTIDVKVEKSAIESIVWHKAYQEAKRIWRRLASSKYYYIRAAVAGVSLIPIDLIKRLSTDKTIYVLFRLALNDSLYLNPENRKNRDYILNELIFKLKKYDRSKIDDYEFLAKRLLRINRFIEGKKKFELTTTNAYLCEIAKTLYAYIDDQRFDLEDKNICTELFSLIQKNCIDNSHRT